MMNNGISGASLTIADHRVRADLTAAPVAPPRYPVSVPDAVTKLLTAAAVLLLLPAMLVVGLLALLVPCFLSVPVCGPEIRPPRAASRR